MIFAEKRNWLREMRRRPLCVESVSKNAIKTDMQ
jgi:hypothetical protein